MRARRFWNPSCGYQERRSLRMKIYNTAISEGLYGVFLCTPSPRALLQPSPLPPPTLAHSPQHSSQWLVRFICLDHLCCHVQGGCLPDFREGVQLQSALIIDATGVVGHALLKDMLKTKNFDRVGEYGRQVTPADKIPQDYASKLQQKVIDPARLEEGCLSEGNWDVVFIT